MKRSRKVTSKKSSERQEKKSKKNKDEKANVDLRTGGLYWVDGPDPGYCQLMSFDLDTELAFVRWMYTRDDLLQHWGPHYGIKNVVAVLEKMHFEDGDLAFTNHYQDKWPVHALTMKMNFAQMPPFFAAHLEESTLTRIKENASQWISTSDQCDDAFNQRFPYNAHTQILQRKKQAENAEDEDEEDKEEEEQEEKEEVAQREEKEEKGEKDMVKKAADMPVELRELHDSLCASNDMYFHTTAGNRQLVQLCAWLHFGNTGKTDQTITEYMRSYFLGGVGGATAAAHCFRPIAQYLDATYVSPSLGMCALCGMKRHLKYRIYLDSNFDDLLVGNECASRLRKVMHRIGVIHTARETYRKTPEVRNKQGWLNRLQTKLQEL